MNSKKSIILASVFAVIAIILIIAIVMSNNKENKKVNKSNNVGSINNSQIQAEKEHEQERKKYSNVLYVYNAAQYMDKSAIMDFEKEYKVRVEYSEFESNEDMYDNIIKNPDKYDVLIPSDYMIDRLIKEDKLAKLDKDKINNISNVAREYLSPEYDKNNDYTIPYMTGTLGILYNTKKVTKPVDSWIALFDQTYRGKILMWDSERDCLGATLKMLGYSMNSKNQSELVSAQNKLIEQRSYVKYGEEEIRDMMIAGEGTVSLMYSGEAKNAMNQNRDLDYIIPKEGGNKWIDGFVIVKNTKHLEMAHNFINFMCRSNIAIRNMTTTGYTSAIKGAWGEFGNDKVMFPSEEELSRCEAFLYDKDAVQLYNQIWSKVH